MLSADLRTCPGILGPAELASIVVFGEVSDAKTLDELAALLALAHTPGAFCWLPR